MVAKCLAHWLVTGLPLTVLAPLLALLLHLEVHAYPALVAGMALGTPTLSLIGAIGAALTLGARRGGVLLSLLVLPLYIPVLIFGVAACEAAAAGLRRARICCCWAALLVLALPLAPFAAAAAGCARRSNSGAICARKACVMHRFANPARFMRLSASLLPWCATLAARFSSRSGLWLALFVAPADYQQGDAVRIMYVHVPAAWMASFVYAVMALSSAVGLIWRHPLADIAARAAAPLGAGFTLVCLVSGSLWGEPMWGTWWVWDARLTSVLVLFFLYLGYIALVNAFDDPTRGSRAGAVLALVGIVNLPIIKFSVDWWNTLHQPASVFRLGGPTIAPRCCGRCWSWRWASCCFRALLLVRMRTALMAAKVRALRHHRERRARQRAVRAAAPRAAWDRAAMNGALRHFLAMGGYARFVWPAYGVAALVLGYARRRRRGLLSPAPAASSRRSSANGRRDDAQAAPALSGAGRARRRSAW